MKQRQIVRQGRRVALAACGLLMCAWTLQSCKDDDILLTGQPSWLGNSIYERLAEDGQYKTLVRLVDDLGQHEVLSHTGSKTLFAANDSAFQAWFKNNQWGVSSYEQLSVAQKKLLLNNSMVNNAYLIELLSNVSANPPKEGMCMRRETATSIYDSVQIVTPDMMPTNSAAWKKYKDAGRSIRVLKDATTPPMIHLLPAYMKYYSMTPTDLEVLTNHQTTNINEAWVNGKHVTERDITCKNGYIHKVDGVIESSPNMAEIIRTHPNMSMWSHLLDRFSAPYRDDAATKEFDRLYNSEDTVYVLRYYSDLSTGGSPNDSDPDKEQVDARLKFDPGWNQYMYTNTMNYDLHYDCGVMIVPTNDALQEWWDGEGRDLQDNYKDWDSIPAGMISTLINVNMLQRFTSAFPSKFDMVVNDAMESLGIKPEDVDSCFMGCNGMVYLTNKVFTPAEFSSVAYPAAAHDKTMNIIYWSLSGAEKAPSRYSFPFNYLPYLLSMDSYYSLLLPTNDAMLWYVDPCYYGKKYGETTVLQFWYDSRQPVDERVQAYRYKASIEDDGTITIGDRVQTKVDKSVIRDRLKKLVNDLIVVGNIEDGHEYYKTKAGSLLRVTREGGRLAIAGGWQKDRNTVIPINSNEIFTKKNGKSYQLNANYEKDASGNPIVLYEGGMPLSAENSVYLTLKNHEEFLQFFDLFDDENANLMSPTQHSYTAGLSALNNKNCTLMDNFNYTIYVPTNESILKLIEEDKLPTWADYRAIDEDYDQEGSWCYKNDAVRDSARLVIKNIIVNFLRYHVQDHSIAINMAPEFYEDKEDGTREALYKNDYESMTRNPKTGRFFPITVDNSGDQMTLRDVKAQAYLKAHPGETVTPYDRHVMKENGLYNLICREYWIAGEKSLTSATINSTSDAVVHQIDGTLMYQDMPSWKAELNKLFGRPLDK